MLTTLPPEILTHIAHYLVDDSGAPPVSLLCASRTLCATLSPAENPNLYARVFRDNYDVGAVARRLSPAPTQADLASELRTRTAALGRLGQIAAEIARINRKEIVRQQAATEAALTAQQVWVNDEKVEPHPTSPTTATFGKRAVEVAGKVQAADLWVVYLMLLENDTKNVRRLVPPLAPGPSADIMTVLDAYHERTLATRVAGYPPEQVVDALAMWIAWLLQSHSTRNTQMHRALRPYVFAAHHYELFFAPWMLLELPSAERRTEVFDRFVVDQNPKSRANIVPYYGRPLEIAHPILTHAAILRFFSDADMPDPEGESTPSAGTPTFDPEMDGVADLRTPPRPVLKSRLYDADFERLCMCADGRTSAGRPLAAWKGVFGGYWEGTFTFLDFGAFRDMITGHDSAMYQGEFGEQAQVWKLRETFVRPRVGTAGPSGSAGGASGAAGAGGARGLPLSGPMTNAGFPTDMRPFAIDPLSRRPPGTSPEDAMIDDALGRQLDALDGYEAIPESEIDAELASGRPDVGLLVTGMGHSAWGRFLISGHVRPWDGLLYLVKEYAPYQRGKWVYRGYVLSNDILVGRWRDTVTREDYFGYEGTFILKRR